MVSTFVAGSIRKRRGSGVPSTEPNEEPNIMIDDGTFQCIESFFLPIVEGSFERRWSNGVEGGQGHEG